VAHAHPFASGPAVASVVKGIRDQTGGCETLRDVIVSAGMLAVSVRKDHHAAGFDLRIPDVIDDADSTYAREGSLSALNGHQPRVVGASN
jgi:hypothetical protein